MLVKEIDCRDMLINKFRLSKNLTKERANFELNALADTIKLPTAITV